MKNLIVGIALATAGALMAQDLMMESGMFGRFSLSVDLNALMSKKSITTTTTMATKYKAEYSYAPDGQNTIGQNRGVLVQSNAAMTPVQANQSISVGNLDLDAQHADVSAASAARNGVRKGERRATAETVTK